MDRQARIRLVARECLARRSGGENVPDAAIADSHPELMPELAVELRRLAVIGRALSEAKPSEHDSRSAQLSALSEALDEYTLLSEIHRGGQGVVYRAFHRSTGREVALKVLLGGAWSDEGERARLRREVRVLAALRHPNIVTIHDSGSAAGVDYLVTDLIDGVRLDEFAESVRSLGANDARGWPRTPRRAAEPRLRRLLKVFAKVCRAVHAAHLLGVIHRDLKPANILVDDADEPYVLDFGLARLGDTDDSLAPGTLTQTGQFVGSLPWASPEQAAGVTDGLDVRSDVYSLGVVLYQVLTGEFPYKVTGAVHEVVANIASADPRPARRVCCAIDADIETILCVCLCKRREQRYQSAGELAVDVESYLSGRPLLARRENPWHALRKFARRHRALVSTGGAAVLLLGAWLVAFFVQAQQVARARDAAQGVSEFLEGVLAAGDPLAGGAARPGYTVREMLDETAARAATELADRPEVASAVHQTLGVAYTNLGAFDRAREQLDLALELRNGLFGRDSRDAAETHHALAELLQSTGEIEPAIEHCREALRIRRVGGPGELSALSESLTLLAALLREQGQFGPAEEAAREALSGVDRAPSTDAALRARCLNTLASIRRALGALDEAEALYREALELRRAKFGASHPDVAASLSNLAGVLHERGDLAAAESSYREALETTRSSLGDENPAYTVRILSGLANVQAANGQAGAAEQTYREALGVLDAAPSAAVSDRAGVLNNLGLLLLREQRLDEAEPLIVEAVETYRRLSPGTAGLASAIENLGGVRLTRGDRRGAEELFQETLNLRRSLLPPDHPDIAQTLMKLAAAQRGTGDSVVVETLYREALAIRRHALGPAHAQTISALSALAGFVERAGRSADAVPLYRELLSAQREAAGHHDPDVIECGLKLAGLLRETGELDEAEALYRDALASQRRIPGEHGQAIALTLNSLAKLLILRNEAAEADTLLAESVALLREAGAAPWMAAAVESTRGECLARLERFADAEALLTGAHTVLERERGAGDDLTRGAIERLVGLYERWDRPDEARAWRERLTDSVP
ncbi:MAG: serine/threonine protein kinase [Phycisphaerae bacterium]